MGLMLILLIVILLLLIAVILMIPIEKKKAKKRKREEDIKEESPIQKDFEAKITHLEHHIQSQHKQIGEWEKRVRQLEKEVAIETVKNSKLQEKLAQERTWHEKEDVEIAKFNKEINALKTDLKQAQDHFSKEHMINLKLENELKELQRKHEDLVKDRRESGLENDQLKAKIDSLKRDIQDLKKENIQLHKKEDDKQWVAMTEYQRLEMKLKEKEKELERLKRDSN